MSASQFTQHLAIVVGINQYSNGIATLQTAANDAHQLAHLLRVEHGYDVQLLLDQAATRKNLLSFLEQVLPQVVSADDRILFYFAGHGIALDGEDGPAGYLVPQDAKPGEETTFLPMRVLHDALTALPCRHSLIILDCCFSGAFRWSSTRDIAVHPEIIYKERYDRFIQSPAWQVITSSAYDQTAFDLLQDQRGHGHTGKHSPFAEALFDALQGYADRYPVATNGQPSGDGVITATELYLYLRDRVELATEAINQCQTPGLWPLRKHDKGEYIFLVPGHELNLPPAPDLNPANNPYRGLESFDETQAHLFFGRHQLVEELQSFVLEHPMTVVLGPSGTGKSSLVKAGLIPALRNSVDTDWQILPPIRPGDAPLKALALAILSLETDTDTLVTTVEALAENLAHDPRELSRRVLTWGERHPQKRLLLVVDQFEELITQCRQEAERQQFLELLKKALRLGKTQGRIVLTLRSDFEPQFQGWLSQGWMRSRFLVKPMTQDELRQAIEAPAAERVMVFEPYSLVDQLINEVVQMPGALPLLSFTLSELYLRYLQRRSDDRALTQTDYEALGGVAGSLTQRATQEYEALKQQDPAYEHTMKRVMLRMVAIEGGELARRRVPRSELVYPNPEEDVRVEEVIRRLTAARLVVEGQDPGGEPYVEPAHDALVQGWNQLQRWKNEEQENLSLQRLLTPAARAWQLNQRNLRDLWANNSRLERLVEIDRSPQSWLNQLETEFIGLSLRRRRNNRRWRVGWFSSAFLALGTLAVAVFIYAGMATRQAQIAQANEKTALENEERANQEAERADEEAQNAKEEAERANREADRAVESEELAEQRQKEAEEQRDLAEERQQEAEDARNAEKEQRQIADKQRDLADKRRQEAEQRRIEAERSNAIALVRSSMALFESGQQINALTTIIQAVKSALNSDWFSQNNQLEIILGFQKIIYGTKEVNRIGPQRSISSVTFSPEGDFVASSSSLDGNINIWSLNGKLHETLEGSSGVNSIAVNKSSNILLAVGREGYDIWKKDKNQAFKHYKNLTYGRGEYFSHAVFSPISSYAFLAGPNENITLLNLGEISVEKQVLGNHPEQVKTVEVSTDGSHLVTASDSSIKLWRMASREDYYPTLEKELLNQRDISGAYFLTENKIAITKDTGEIFVKSLSEDLQFDSLDKIYDGDKVLHFVSNPTTQMMMVADRRGTVEVLNFDGDLIYSLPAKIHLQSEINLHPNGKILASSGKDGFIHFWDLSGGINTDFIEGEFFSLSPEGKLLFIGLSKGDLLVCSRPYSKENCLKFHSSHKHNGGIQKLYVSKDENFVASVGEDRAVGLWDREQEKFFQLGYHTDKRRIKDISINYDSTVAVSGSLSELLFWNISERRVMGECSNPEISGIFALSPKENLVAVSKSGGILELAKSLNGFTSCDLIGLSVIDTKHQSINQVKFSADGQLLATIGSDRIIRIWGIYGDLRSMIKVETSDIRDIDFVDNDTIMASTSDGNLYFFTSKGKLIEELKIHGSENYSSSFSQDGKYLISVGLSSKSNTKKIVIRAAEVSSLNDELCIWVDRIEVFFFPEVKTYCESRVD